MRMSRTSKEVKDAENQRMAEDIIRRTPGSNQDCRCIAAIAKLVMLNGRVLREGRAYDPKTKSLGVGVHQVWYHVV